MGDPARAQAELERMLERSKTERVDGVAMGEALVALGQYDEALDWLERAVGERSPDAV
ncbi:MAG TPA: tetratricopeptide repeat protein [Rhodothermales bacterium]